MKLTTFMIAILIGCICYGQFQITNTFEKADTIKPNQDTVKVIMLVCDTSFVPNSTSIVYLSQINGYADTIGYIPNRIPYTWWQFGYEVRKFGYGLLWPPKELTYLDECKRPLPKTIIVWVSATLSQ